MHCVAQCEVS